MITLYGIKSCATIRKARRWLDQHNIDYIYHDVRMDGITKQQIKKWANEIDWQVLLNKRGTSWRQLEQEQRDNITKNRAVDLMVEYPTLIKRPLLDTGTLKLVGFNETEYQKHLT